MGLDEDELDDEKYEQVIEWFEKHEDEQCHSERLAERFSPSDDVHAFILLDKVDPLTNTKDRICSASHDQIWLEANVRLLSEENVIDLLRCGVWYDSEHDGLAMFV